MEFLTKLEDLEALYGKPGTASQIKVAPQLAQAYAKWISASRFCVLSTSGPEGTDGSPRGDESPVVTVLNPKTLALPDWNGNKRLDTMRNIIRDPRISLMFMVAGSTTVMRVNGTAKITTDEGLRATYEKNGKTPATVLVIQIDEVYPQCARAVMRAGLWKDGDQSADLPTLGAMLKEITNGEFDGEAYDKAWPERAVAGFW